MNMVTELAEQYVYESELHLAHLDALLARATRVPLDGEAQAELEALVKRMQRGRDRLAGELDSLRRFPGPDGSEQLAEEENLSGVFQTVGLQLEKALGAVLEHGRPRRPAAR